jgi:hypothetical protein
VSFKDFLDTEEITFRYSTNEGKKEKTIKIENYKKTLDSSILYKNEKKRLKTIIEGRGEVPVFCEEVSRFLMVNLTTKKSREIKSRDDKVSCGLFFNGMLIEAKNKSEEDLKKLMETKLSWEVPTEIYRLER